MAIIITWELGSAEGQAVLFVGVVSIMSQNHHHHHYPHSLQEGDIRSYIRIRLFSWSCVQCLSVFTPALGELFFLLSFAQQFFICPIRQLGQSSLQVGHRTARWTEGGSARFCATSVASPPHIPKNSEPLYQDVGATNTLNLTPYVNWGWMDHQLGQRPSTQRLQLIAGADCTAQSAPRGHHPFAPAPPVKADRRPSCSTVAYFQREPNVTHANQRKKKTVREIQENLQIRRKAKKSIPSHWSQKTHSLSEFPASWRNLTSLRFFYFIFFCFFLFGCGWCTMDRSSPWSSDTVITMTRARTLRQPKTLLGVSGKEPLPHYSSWAWPFCT
ncbi:hypothetical protein DFJ77DRAFT_345679 [Powellomyces hirtus]|nr:hypothetical protein DFJ77DRAFT_345679 [Powellomyces hirtus]